MQGEGSVKIKIIGGEAVGEPHITVFVGAKDLSAASVIMAEIQAQLGLSYPGELIALEVDDGGIDAEGLGVEALADPDLNG